MVNLGGTQKVDFLGTCFGGEGLGLNSWAMISFMGRRAPHHGVHARDDVRWSIWEKNTAVHPRCSVLEPTRHMARTRAPDRHAKILPEPFTLPRALAGPRPAQNLNKA